jgi:hypothetical protein
MKNPFEIIEYWLSQNEMTADEKRRMKSALISYATTHPVRSGLLSPYTFRYATMALASLVIVLGGSVGLTSASLQALPNQRLYPIKLFVEEFRASSQKTPEAVIAYETKRIETRFNEATKLALTQKLDDNTSAVVQAGLEHSREVIRTTANGIQNQNPELALAATTILETTFSSNGKILASIEKNTNQNIGTIVLAAQVTTKKLASEKIKFEQSVSLKPNDDTKSQAADRLAFLEKKLSTFPESPVATAATMTATADATTPVAVTSPNAKAFVQGTVLTALAPEPVVTIPEKPEVLARNLIAQAKEKIRDGFSSEALVLIQKAEQLLDEASLTETLEHTYQVKTEMPELNAQ